MTIYEGKEVNLFVMIVLKNAINLYLNTGLQANRAYTPKNMLAKAGQFTGKTYKRGQLKQAQEDLEAILAQIRAEREGMTE